MYSRSRLASRLATAGVLATAVGLGTAACGGGSTSGSSDPASSAATTQPRVVPTGLLATVQNASQQERSAFTQCMRKNGLPSFPDSLSLTALHAAGITLRSSSFLAAARTCWSDLTGTG